MSRANKVFRKTLAKRYLNAREQYGLFRYGKLMNMKYAKGYCKYHNCLLCAHDFKEKNCTRCSHFTTELINAY